MCVSNNAKSTGRNFIKFDGLIGHDLRMNRLDFGSVRPSETATHGFICLFVRGINTKVMDGF